MLVVTIKVDEKIKTMSYKLLKYPLEEKNNLKNVPQKRRHFEKEKRTVV